MEVTFVQMGKFTESIEHYEKGLLLYDPQQHRDDAFQYSQNPGVALRSHAAWALWYLGQPDSALNLNKEALAQARELCEPHGLAHTLYFAAILHHLRGENQLAQQHAEAAIEVSTEHGLSIYEAFGIIARGSTLVQQGSTAEGIEQIRHGLAVHERTGARLARPYFLALLADALRSVGKIDESLRVIDDALSLSHQRGEERYLAELYRLKGELLLMLEVPNAADCFNEAIKVAQRQSAKSLELRATMSLARLDKGYADGLAGVYNSFTEGFDTKDLRDAKALLDELSSSSG